MSAKRIPCVPSPASGHQRGVMLIEALIAILIFSIGILGIVGLQASAVQQSTDAKNRAEAAYLADQLMGRMWTDTRTVSNLQAKYNSCGSSCTGYWDWYGNVKNILPGVSDAITDTQPQVTVDGQGVVTVTLYWRSPSEPSTSTPHRYDIQAQIGQ